jgi:hypothetical protein
MSKNPQKSAFLMLTERTLFTVIDFFSSRFVARLKSIDKYEAGVVHKQQAAMTKK